MMIPNDPKKQEKIKKLLANLPQDKFWDSKRRDFISRLYKINEEKKSIVEYIPIPRERVPVFAGAFATLILCVFCYTYLFAPMSPVVNGVKGTVKIFRAGRNEWTMAKASGEKLGKNDILKTFEGGQADILIPNRYHMRLKGNTEIKLAKSTSRLLPGTIKYSLAKGKIYTYYKKAAMRKQKFAIDTPSALASVLGTDFMMEVGPVVSKTWIGVLDGVVSVTGLDTKTLTELKDTTVYVEPGEKTTVSAGRSPAAPERMVEDELFSMEELYRIGTKPQVALLISTGRRRVRELLSVTPLYIATADHVLTEKIKNVVETFSQAIKEGSKEKYIENIQQLEEIVNKYPNPKYDVQFLLFIAAYYEYLDEHTKAIVTFRRVIESYPNSDLASLAQCAIGIIYEEKISNPVMAKGAYQTVIARYPASPEVKEAQAGLERLSR